MFQAKSNPVFSTAVQSRQLGSGRIRARATPSFPRKRESRLTLSCAAAGLDSRFRGNDE
jgi:hypothetical protein